MNWGWPVLGFVTLTAVIYFCIWIVIWLSVRSQINKANQKLAEMHEIQLEVSILIANLTKFLGVIFMTASVSTRLMAVALLVSTSLLCSACRTGAASNAPSPEGAQASTEEATAEPQVDPCLVAYAEVLDNIGNYDFKVESDAASKSYGYTLVQVEGQRYPYLLVEQAMDEDMGSVRIFAFDPKSQTVVAPDETFSIGAASAGGYRGDLSISNKHPHLEFMTTMGGTGETEVVELAVNDGKLVKRTLVSGRIDMLDERDTSELTWTDIKDRSLLQGGSNDSKDAKSGSVENP